MDEAELKESLLSPLLLLSLPPFLVAVTKRVRRLTVGELSEEVVSGALLSMLLELAVMGMAELFGEECFAFDGDC